MAIKSGRSGEAHWTTCDMGMSYEPTIRIGDYNLFIGRGATWGAQDESSALVSLTQHVTVADEDEESDFKELGTATAVDILQRGKSLRLACQLLLNNHTELSEVQINDVLNATIELINALKEVVS